MSSKIVEEVAEICAQHFFPNAPDEQAQFIKSSIAKYKKPRVPFEEVAERCAQRLFPDDPEFQAHFIRRVTEVRNKSREKYAQPAAEAMAV